MGLEDIQKKIISDAEQKKAELLTVAEQKCAEIINHAKQTVQEYKNDHDKSALSTAENLQRGLVIDARRKLANEILARKRKRIENVFIKAKEEFISSSDYNDTIKAMVIKSSLSKKEEIVLGKNEKALDQKWLDSVNQAGSSSLSFSSQTGEFKGGVMLKDGDTFINITVDTLFSLLREETEKPVADLLFRG